MDLQVVRGERDRLDVLVCRCQAGDREAFGELYSLYGDRVYSIAFSYLRGDAEAAEDVMQTVFVNLHQGIKRFRRDAVFTTWLYRMVINACTDEFRRRRRFVPWADMPLEPTVQQQPDLGSEILTAVQGLSPKLRMPILLKYYEDLSYQEIAEVLDCSMGTVASRLNRAHAALAKRLPPEAATR